jgi:hypothetical protein
MCVCESKWRVSGPDPKQPLGSSHGYGRHCTDPVIAARTGREHRAFKTPCKPAGFTAPSFLG